LIPTEKIWSYEAGLKSEWFDHRLRVNADGFYYSYSDLQVQQLLGPGNASITNAATATGRGLELEILANPIDALQLTANGSLLEAKYSSYPTVSLPAGLTLPFAPVLPGETCFAGPPRTCSVSGSHHYLDNAPTASFTLAADYTYELDAQYALTAHLDYNWRARQYFDPSNALLLSQSAYGLLNAQVGLNLPDQTWRVELYGKNLTNQVYAVVKSGASYLPGELTGDPRTYGIRVVRNW
jgi:iron complex outermembrane receptor protein